MALIIFPYTQELNLQLPALFYMLYIIQILEDILEMHS